MRKMSAYRLGVAGIALLLSAACDLGGGGDDEGQDLTTLLQGGSGECVSAEIGDDSMCLDTGMWALGAWKECMARGQYLADVAPYRSCGDGLFHRAIISCCGGSGASPAEPGGCWPECAADGTCPDHCPPVDRGEGGCVEKCDSAGQCEVICGGTDPNGVQCTTSEVWDDMCRPADAWHEQAVDLCAAQGLLAAKVDLTGTCQQGEGQLVLITCCSPEGTALPPTGCEEHCENGSCFTDCSPDATDPASCTVQTFGDGLCQEPGSFEVLAFEACASMELQVVGFQLYDQCDDGGFAFAMVECCGAPDPNVDPDGCPQGCAENGECDPACSGSGGDAPACIVGSLGPGPCQTPFFWQEMASAACAAQGLALTEISAGDWCDDGGSIAELKYVCCAPGAGDPDTDPATGCSVQCDETGQCFEECGTGTEPPWCETIDLGTGTGCESDDAWMQKALEACEEMGLLLQEIGPYEECGNGGFGMAAAVCCSGPV